MKNTVRIDKWQLAWIENATVNKKAISLKTPKDVKKGKYQTIQATVPGNFELDFMREGLLDDVYMGENSVQTQKLENLHLYYFTEFSYEPKEQLMSREAAAFAAFIRGENREDYARASELADKVHTCMDTIKEKANIVYGGK